LLFGPPLATDYPFNNSLGRTCPNPLYANNGGFKDGLAFSMGKDTHD